MRLVLALGLSWHQTTFPRQAAGLCAVRGVEKCQKLNLLQLRLTIPPDHLLLHPVCELCLRMAIRILKQLPPLDCSSKLS